MTNVSSRQFLTNVHVYYILQLVFHNEKPLCAFLGENEKN